MPVDGDEKAKHAANVINVEDYLSKRMNKFAPAEPAPTGYRPGAGSGRTSPRAYEPSAAVIPTASQAALRQAGLHLEEASDSATPKGAKFGRAFVSPSATAAGTSPSARSRPSPKAGDGILFYKSPVRVRVGTPTNTVRPGMGVSPGRGRVLRPRSPDSGALRGTSPRWVYSPAKAVPSKPAVVEPKGPKGAAPVPALSRVTAAPETTRQVRGASETPLPEYNGAEYRNLAGYRSTPTQAKAAEHPRYRTTPVPTRSSGTAVAARSGSASSTHPSTTSRDPGGPAAAISRRRSGPAPQAEGTLHTRAATSAELLTLRSGSGGEQVVSRLPDGRHHSRESGTTTPLSSRSIPSRQSGDPMQPAQPGPGEDPPAKGEPARGGPPGDVYTHQQGRRSSLTLVSSSAPISPTVSRGRVSSGGGVVGMRGYDPRLSPTISRRTTTYNHVQSSGYGPSGAYVRSRPRSHSGGPSVGAQRAVAAAPRPAFLAEPMPLPTHSLVTPSKPLHTGLESRVSTQPSPAKTPLRAQGSPMKPTAGYPRTFMDHGVRTPDTSPRVTLRLGMSPRTASSAAIRDMGLTDFVRIPAGSTTPDPGMDIPLSPERVVPSRLHTQTPPRSYASVDDHHSQSGTATPRSSSSTSPRRTAVTPPRGSPAMKTSPPPPQPPPPSHPHPQPVPHAPPPTPSADAAAAAAEAAPERPPIAWPQVNASPPREESRLHIASSVDSAALVDASPPATGATGGGAGDGGAEGPAAKGSGTPVKQRSRSQDLPPTVVNFTHAGPAVADLAPQSPPPAGSSTAPPPSPRVSLTNLHCNGDARPEPLAPLAAEVTPRQKRPSILDTPFQPIKPTVKPVDPGLLFHTNRVEPRRGDPNLVRQGEVFADRYEVVRRLGSGDWSTVWLGFDRLREIFVALKVSKETRSKALHEVNIYNQMNAHIDAEEHEEGDYNCIIRMLDYFEGRVAGGLNTIMVFEVLGKDLLSLITFPNGALCYKGIPLPWAKKIAKCSLQGLAYMHEVTRVFHCDLKPENILLNCRSDEQFANIRDILQQFLSERQQRSGKLNDAELRRYLQVTYGDPTGVKIIDLGASRAIGDTLYSVDMIQTLEYRSPEVVLGFSPVDAAIDIWSMACIMWEMLTGVYLFNPGEDKPRNPVHVGLFIARLGDFPAHMATAPGKHVSFFFDGNGAFRYQKYPHLGFQELTAKHGFSQQEADEVVDFLLPMLRYDPKERVTAREHLKHPWLAGV